jgi:hypothetical protein
MVKAKSQCSNVTYAGEIGINEPTQYGLIPARIRNIELPSGGDTTKSFEYLWLMTIDSLTTIGNTWNVTVVNSGNDSSYQHTSPIFTKTWFRRCARRAGCSSYVGETEWIQVLAPNTGLPIYLNYFNITDKNLVWNVENKKDLQYINILSSLDGKKWINFAKIENNVDYYSIEKSIYQFYKLELVDLDNKINYSKILYKRQSQNEFYSNDYLGLNYIIFNINGQIIEKGVFTKPIQLNNYQKIKFLQN